MPSTTPQQIQNSTDAANFYSGFGLAPAPDAGNYMASPSTPSQVGALYSGILPIASSASRTASAPPVAPGQYVPASAGQQPNFYESPGISQAQVNHIGTPLSAYVNSTGQRVAAQSPAVQAVDQVGNAAAPLIDYSDPLWAAYRDGGDSAAQAELAQENAAGALPMAGAASRAAAPAGPVMPIMATAAAAATPARPSVMQDIISGLSNMHFGANWSMQPASAPITGPPVGSPNGYEYAPNAAGAYTRVGVAPAFTGMSPAQQYAAAAAPALASQPNGNVNNGGNANGQSVAHGQSTARSMGGMPG